MVQLAPEEHEIAVEGEAVCGQLITRRRASGRHQTPAYLPQVEHIAPGQLPGQEGPAESQQHLVLFLALQTADDVHCVFPVQFSRL